MWVLQLATCHLVLKLYFWRRNLEFEFLPRFLLIGERSQLGVVMWKSIERFCRLYRWLLADSSRCYSTIGLYPPIFGFAILYWWKTACMIFEKSLFPLWTAELIWRKRLTGRGRADRMRMFFSHLWVLTKSNFPSLLTISCTRSMSVSTNRDFHSDDILTPLKSTVAGVCSPAADTAYITLVCSSFGPSKNTKLKFQHNQKTRKKRKHTSFFEPFSLGSDSLQFRQQNIRRMEIPNAFRFFENIQLSIQFLHGCEEFFWFNGILFGNLFFSWLKKGNYARWQIPFVFFEKFLLKLIRHRAMYLCKNAIST